MTTSRAPPVSLLPAFFASSGITKQKITDQRFLFLGAGSAGTGIAELISQAMAMEGMDIHEARRRNALFDVNGLLTTSRTDLAEFQKPFAQDRAPISTFVEAVKALKPTGIIGVSGMPKLFNREVIEAMAEINRAADHLSLLQSDLALRMLGGGGLSLVRRPRHFCQRQPISTGRYRREEFCRTRATTSTSSLRWPWRFLSPRQSASPKTCSSSPHRPSPSRSAKKASRPG